MDYNLQITASNKDVCDKEAKFLSSVQKLPYCPIVIDSGEGALLYDLEGNEYIDFLASASSANIGHGNKEIADAVREQMGKITQYTIVYTTTEPPVSLAEKIVSLVPGDNDKKVLYSTTGSESIDAAMKLAKGYTGRNKVISFKGAYHGSTYGSISLSAISLSMKRKIGSLIPDVHHFNYPTCLKCPYGKYDSTCNLECLKEIEDAFDMYLPPEEVAAIFFEPIAGDAGLIVPPAKYVECLYNICKKNGILFVVDEIQQAFGRTGKWFAIENFNIEPDLIVLGKSCGAGFPLGMVVGRSDIMECLDAPAHGFTLAGDTTVCVASLKMIEIFERDNIVNEAKRKGDYLKDKLNLLKEKYPEIVKDVRGIGLSIGVDILDRYTTTKICYQSIKNGLLVISLGGNTLRIQPPLVISIKQIDEAIKILEDSIIDFINDDISDEAFESVRGW